MKKEFEIIEDRGSGNNKIKFQIFEHNGQYQIRMNEKHYEYTIVQNLSYNDLQALKDFLNEAL